MSNHESNPPPPTTSCPTPGSAAHAGHAPLCRSCGGPTTTLAPPPWSASSDSPPPAYRPIRMPAINAPTNTAAIVLSPVPQPLPLPPASPPFAFQVPAKRITSPDDIARFHASFHGRHFLGFVAALSASVHGRKLSDPLPSPPSPAVSALLDLISALSAFVASTPPHPSSPQLDAPLDSDRAADPSRRPPPKQPQQEQPLGAPPLPMSTSSADSSPPVSGLDYDDTALTLALPGSSSSATAAAADPERKRAAHDDDKLPSPKARAVGWPPVRAYRRNALREEAAKLVKVAVDGAPYLRKVDLAAHGGYAPLLRALHGMFASCLAVRGDGCAEGTTTTKLVDSVTGAEYVPTYEDKDGDWMLVGDVPWKMFMESCKRIRLMKSSEAVNLSTRRSSR